LIDFNQLYQEFSSPITEKDCGIFCSPYNEYGIPFCCDSRHAVPSAYHQEWAYLQAHTDLWQIWQPDNDTEQDAAVLRDQTPESQVLITCKGHQVCQRQFRTLTCRAFPFYPYFTSKDELLGLSYYWEYRFKCWVISHLDQVSRRFLDQCLAAFSKLFEAYPSEREAFSLHSAIHRQQMISMRRRLTLLHKDGLLFLISPRDESLHPIPPAKLPKYGVYAIADCLPFPEELELNSAP